MRILHTSDLHLGMAWKEHPREQDQWRVLDEILALCDERQIELLLIAGDVFSDRLHDSRIRHEEIARRLLTKLSGRLRRGLAVCLLRGNHDPLPLFRLMRFMASEMAGADRWPLVVADLPDIYRIPGREADLQIVAAPYIEPQRLATEAPDPQAAPEQRLLDLTGLLGLRLRQLYERADPHVPAIFTAHFTVDSPLIQKDQYLESHYVQELTLHRDWLPGFTSYNALGHIHLRQELRLAEKPTWYSGAPDRMNLGELEYEPGVLIVTTPAAPGGAATVETVPLTTSSAWVREDLEGPRAVERFCARWAERNPLGEVKVRGIAPAEHGAVEALLRQAAPRVEVRWLTEENTEPTAFIATLDHLDVNGTVNSFLDRMFAEQPELQERLRHGFAELLAGNASATKEVGA